MKDRFVVPPNGNPGRLIRDIDEAKTAIDAVFWFRQYNGLEKYYYDWQYDYVDFNDYNMCSQNTQRLVNIYSNFISDRDSQYTVARLYPLLTRINLWFDEQYSSSDKSEDAVTGEKFAEEKGEVELDGEGDDGSFCAIFPNDASCS